MCVFFLLFKKRYKHFTTPKKKAVEYMSVHRWSLTQNESPFSMRLPFRKEEQGEEEGIENENYNRGGGMHFQSCSSSTSRFCREDYCCLCWLESGWVGGEWAGCEDMGTKWFNCLDSS